MGKIIAIGAIGGSGTRAVAQVLIELGIYMGDDLNHPNDNLIFTRLFRNPAFYKTGSKSGLNERLDIFKRYMERDHLDPNDVNVLIKAAKENPTFKYDKSFDGNMLRKVSSLPKQREFWGWKEPNTHIYLDEINELYHDFKYIHVLRHGLEMAFSTNRKQLVNWGYKYNINLQGNEKDDEIVYKQLEYWIESTKEAIKKGERLGDNFLLINHCKFCNDPKAQISKIIDFTGLKVQENKLSELCKIPKKTKSLGRHKKHCLALFDQKQIDFVRQFDFEIS